MSDKSSRGQSYDEWVASLSHLIDKVERTGDLVTPERYVSGMTLHPNSGAAQGRPLPDDEVRAIFESIMGNM